MGGGRKVKGGSDLLPEGRSWRKGRRELGVRRRKELEGGKTEGGREL